MLRYLTAGESHGECLTAILDGMPAGLKVDKKLIDEDLSRRQSGYGRGKRMDIEKDTVKILSGLRKGVSIGSPISILIKNRDFAIDTLPIVTQPRPGHADLAGALKYDRTDIRDILERASARETAARTAVGSICKIFLNKFDIEILSHVVEIGGIKASVQGASFEGIKKIKADSQLNCADPKAEKKMIALIDSTVSKKDTLGGIFEIIIKNVPVGLGSHVQCDRRLSARLAYAIMGIQAIKGVEFGLGFESAGKRGSEVHDEIFYTNEPKGAENFYRKTNNAGGIEGGISNGSNIVIRAAMKPIATVGQPLKSVDILTKKECKASLERSDICAVPSAAVIGESVCAFVIADCMLEKFGGDSMGEIKRNFDSYIKQLKAF